jgi:hypothetical protein
VSPFVVNLSQNFGKEELKRSHQVPARKQVAKGIANRMLLKQRAESFTDALFWN